MNIDVSNYNSIPEEFLRYVIEYKSDFIDQSQKKEFPYDRYKLIASLDDKKIATHESALRTIINKHSIVVGHYTRVFSLDDLQDGLKCLSGDVHYKRIKDYFDLHGIEYSEVEMNELKNCMSNIESRLGGKREGLISLFYPASGVKACEHYAEHIGGEVIEFMKESFKGIYNALSKVGIGVKITACVPICNVTQFFVDRLIDNLIRIILNRDENDETSIEWLNDEIATIKDVDKHQIVSIEEV